MEYDAIDLGSLANRSVRILADLHKEFYGVESPMREPIRLAFLPLDRVAGEWFVAVPEG